MKKIIILALLTFFTIVTSCNKKIYEDQVIPKQVVGLDVLNISQKFDTNTIRINEFAYFDISVSPNDTIGDNIFYAKDNSYTVNYNVGNNTLKLIDETNLLLEIDPNNKKYRFNEKYRFKFIPKTIGKNSIRLEFTSNGKSIIKTYIVYVHTLDTKTELQWVSKYANTIDNYDGNYRVKNLNNHVFTQGDFYDYNTRMNKDTSDEVGNYVCYYRNGKNVVRHVEWGLLLTEDVKERYYIYYTLDNRVSASQMVLTKSGININGMELPNVYIYEPDYTNGFNFDYNPSLDHPHSWLPDPTCTMYCSYCYTHINDKPFEIYLTIKNSKGVIVQNYTLYYYMLPRDCVRMTQTFFMDNFNYDTYGNYTPFGTITHRMIWKYDPNGIPPQNRNAYYKY